PHPRPTLFPYTTLFRSGRAAAPDPVAARRPAAQGRVAGVERVVERRVARSVRLRLHGEEAVVGGDFNAEEVEATLGQRLEVGRRSEEHTSELQSLAYLV